MEILYKSGLKVPILGLGTFQLLGKQAIKTIQNAYDLGYRLVDTATSYANQKDIGWGIKKFSRDSIYISSKINKLDIENCSVKDACNKILSELQTSYLDILFLHYPKVTAFLPKVIDEMLELKAQGFIRAIGISNFSVVDIEKINGFLSFVDVNQIEVHPLFYQKILIEYCQRNNVQVMSLRQFANGILQEEKNLIEIALKHKKSWRQVVLRWLIQNNIQVIPKASSIEHLKENGKIFDFKLSSEEMITLSRLNQNIQTCISQNIDYSDITSTTL